MDVYFWAGFLGAIAFAALVMIVIRRRMG